MNGAAALALDPEPAVAPQPDAAPKPVAATPIEIEIGNAMRDGALVVCRAMLYCFENGTVDPATKAAGAAAIARVAMLQLDYEFGDATFLDTARAAGKREMRRRCVSDGFFKVATPAEVDRHINLCVNHLLTIVGYVVRDERAIRAALAH